MSRPSFASVCAKLAAHDCYMAGAEPKDIARQAGTTEAKARKWIAEVAHARTGSGLPIAEIRRIRRNTR